MKSDGGAAGILVWARHPCRETPTNSTAPYPRACRDSHSPPVAAALLSAKSIEDNVTKPSLFVSNALNSFVRASTTAVSELSVSWPKRGAGTTAGCRQLTAGATAPLTTRDEEATSAVAAAQRTSISRADGMRPNYFRSDHRGAELSGQLTYLKNKLNRRPNVLTTLFAAPAARRRRRCPNPAPAPPLAASQVERRHRPQEAPHPADPGRSRRCGRRHPRRARSCARSAAACSAR